LLLLQEKKVWRKKNEMRCVVSAISKNISQPLKIGYRTTSTKTKNYASGFRLLVWDMKQRLVDAAAGKEGWAQAK
jgi:soluble cytochrome b562